VSALVEDVRINHGGAHIRMAEEFLHGSDIVSRLQEVGGKRMATMPRSA
jgi:hypothetical protein